MKNLKPRKTLKKDELPFSSPFNLESIASKYLEIQKGNPRLQKLMCKFTNESEKRMPLVYESVFSPQKNSKMEIDKAISSKNQSCKRASDSFLKSLKMPENHLLIARPHLHPALNQQNKAKNGAVLKQVETKPGFNKSKNFIMLNKMDAFDQHRLFSKKNVPMNNVLGDKNPDSQRPVGIKN